MANPSLPHADQKESRTFFETVMNTVMAQPKPDERKRKIGERTPLLPTTQQNGEVDAKGVLPSSSQSGEEVDVEDEEDEETTFYLAYGSNLCAKTFLGRRGIRPLSAKNVLVPGFAVVFDLPGLPYLEPCFANLNQRGGHLHRDGDGEDAVVETYMEDLTSLVTTAERDGEAGKKWEKALIGVVYEVTMRDFAKIIMTEGGGEGYQDVLVDCYVLPESSKSKSTESTSTTTTTPTSTATTQNTTNTSTLRAHTLLAPTSKTRPDLPLQPSPRYLNLLITGAKEHNLPEIYIKYLTQLHAYHRTTYRQSAGAILLAATWALPLITTFKLGEIFVDKKTGRVDWWVGRVREFTQMGMWGWYEYFAKWVFGDGVRTVGDEGVQGEEGVFTKREVKEGKVAHGLATDRADVLEGLGDAEEEVVRQVMSLGRK
ncbi:hypothetical protein DFH27DRAFT_397238 [Peziza echinospora]|nr:hypothetical protein DFH27DRAFT_397238 [Peziza echinospora]